VNMCLLGVIQQICTEGMLFGLTVRKIVEDSSAVVP
jgi:hypothetical protein